MPKQRKPARSRRRRTTGRPPVAPPLSVPGAPIATEEEEAELEPGPRQAPVRSETATPPERFGPRTVTVSYQYVTRDLRRILVLATAMIIAIVVISFFLP